MCDKQRPAVLFVVAALVCSAFTFPSSAQEEEQPAFSDYEFWGVSPEELEGSWSWKKVKASGRLDLRYEGRFSEGRNGQEDHDLYQRLQLNLDPLFHEKVSLTFLGRLSEDLDGREKRVDVFRDVLDSFDSSADLRIFNLYLGLKDVVLEDSLLTLGRQYNIAPETVLFDGIRYEKGFSKVDTYAYFGRRQSFFENAFDDTVWGAGVSYRPFSATRLMVDYTHIEEDGIDNDLVAFTARQRIGPYVNLFSRYEFIDERPRDLRLQANIDIPQWALFFDVRYFRSFSTIREESNNVTSFFEILGPLFPYEEWEAIVTKSFKDDKFVLNAGVQVRDVLESDEIGSFNREFDRYFAGFSVEDVWWGVDLDTVWERWLVEEEDETTTSIGVELSKQFADKLEATIGTDFVKYKVEFAQNLDKFRETIDVRAYFGRLSWKVREGQTVQVGYQFEKDSTDEEPFHRIQLAYAIEF